MIRGLDKCYFFPTTSWTGQDVKDWFTLIGLAFDSPDADNQLSGRLLLYSDALKVFTEENWSLLLKRYLAYCLRLQTECPELNIKELRKFYKKLV